MNRIIRNGNRTFILLLAMTCVFIFGCGRRYSSLEEYLQSNPMPDTFTDMSLSAGNFHFTVDPVVSENTLIMKMVSDKAIFSADESTNAKIKEELDRYFTTDGAQDSLNSDIDRFAAASGIDASLISVRYEMYNPGAQTPSYSYFYSKQ